MFYLTREQADEAIDKIGVKGLSNRNTWWSVRRNGQTKTWKTKPGKFCIPIKVGYKSYGYITETSIFCRPGDGLVADFLLESMVAFGRETKSV